MLWRVLNNIHFVHAVVRSSRRGDPCVEKKDTCQCKFCLALTLEQLAQISTPSYKLKKEKREARKSETATPSKESSELVDPSSVSVIGVVGQPSTDKSPSTSSMPPEKKSKKDKLPSKIRNLLMLLMLKPRKRTLLTLSLRSWTANGQNVSTGLKPCFYRKLFNLLSRLRSEFHLLTHHQLTSLKILSPFFNPLGALARNPLQKCISQPASRSRILSLHLQSALARVSLLPSINQPASSHPTDRNHLLLQDLSALVKVPLQLCINQPASLSPTGRLLNHLKGALVPTRLFPNSNIPASLSRAGADLPCLAIPRPTLHTSIPQTRQTDQFLLWLPTPAPLLLSKDRTVSLVSALVPTVIFQTDHRSTSMLRKGSCLRIRTLLPWSRNKYLQKSRLTEKR